MTHLSSPSTSRGGVDELPAGTNNVASFLGLFDQLGQRVGSVVLVADRFWNENGVEQPVDAGHVLRVLDGGTTAASYVTNVEEWRVDEDRMLAATQLRLCVLGDVNRAYYGNNRVGGVYTDIAQHAGDAQRLIYQVHQHVVMPDPNADRRRTPYAPTWAPFSGGVPSAYQRVYTYNAQAGHTCALAFAFTDHHLAKVGFFTTSAPVALGAAYLDKKLDLDRTPIFSLTTNALGAGSAFEPVTVPPT